ncbi:MAG: DNA sulfur modification protein DndB [Geminicoccaceae bacterium]
MTKKLGSTYLPALKGQIGKWAFYTTLMTLSEINERIRLSDEIYKNKNLSDMVQRSVRSDRAGKIAEYLKKEQERFFPAMVVAVFEGEPNWLDFTIKKQSSEIDFDPETLDRAKLDSFGFLALTGEERLFPLDGQHRLAGIREALKDPKAAELFLPDDEVTVMLVAHEPSEEGRTRSRRLFTTLNKRAMSVKKHETIALDEDDVMAIATRHLVERYDPLARDGIVPFRTNANISATDRKVFTTIVTLYDVLCDLFKALSKRSTEDLKFNRPDDDWTEVYRGCAASFFDGIVRTFPVVRQCLKGNDPGAIIAENRRDDGGHILFRPAGQRLIGQLVAEVCKSEFKGAFEEKGAKANDVLSSAQSVLSAAFAKFADLPTDIASKPYVNLIFEPDTQRMMVARSAIVRDIILKRYGLIRPSVDKGLPKRLKSSVGEDAKVADFLW